MRFAAISNLSHSLIVIFTFVWWIYSTISEPNAQLVGFLSHTLTDAFQLIFDNTVLAVVVIGIGLLTAIAHFFLPSIIDPAQIIYLNQGPPKSVTKAMSKGLRFFFVFFAYSGATFVFSILPYLGVLSRSIRGDFAHYPPMIAVFVVRGLIILVANFAFAYAPCAMALEGLRPDKAIRRSAHIAFDHFFITLRYKLLQMVLALRIIINIVVLAGVPLVIVRLLVKMNVAPIAMISALTISSLILLVIIAYINGIIEAFFMAYRYEIYRRVAHESE